MPNMTIGTTTVMTMTTTDPGDPVHAKALSALEALGIEYECLPHPAVYTIEEMAALRLPHSEAIAKNLFLQDDKKQNFYLVTLRGERRANLRRLQQDLGSRKLSVAGEETLSRVLGLSKGAVTPLGILNDEGRQVQAVFDRSYGDKDLIGVHPLQNTATVFLKMGDLASLVRAHGNPLTFLDFA